MNWSWTLCPKNWLAWWNHSSHKVTPISRASLLTLSLFDRIVRRLLFTSIPLDIWILAYPYGLSSYWTEKSISDNEVIMISVLALQTNPHLNVLLIPNIIDRWFYFTQNNCLRVLIDRQLKKKRIVNMENNQYIYLFFQYLSSHNLHFNSYCCCPSSQCFHKYFCQ